MTVASGASLAALLAITFAATGNLALAATHRPNALDGWRQAGATSFNLPKPAHVDIAAAVDADRDRWDDPFLAAEAAGDGREALKAGLEAVSPTFDPSRTASLVAPLPTRALAASEANFQDAPRMISPDAPIQMASMTPATQPVRIAALEQAPASQTLTEADRAAVAVEPAIPGPVRLVPIPRPRPADFASLAQPAASAPSRARVPARGESAAEARPTILAYATPELEGRSDGPNDFFRNLLDQGGPRLPQRRSGVAVYDIASATVRLPNGEMLEAHSGLAHRQDDPKYVREKNRGPTPPNVYDLRMREALFHGAEAIRLLPRDQKKVFNRDGLLAHPYMYAGGGDRSQSNGCVVFKDYGRFLRAFKAGEIAKLVVVPHMGELPSYMAGL